MGVFFSTNWISILSPECSILSSFYENNEQKGSTIHTCNQERVSYMIDTNTQWRFHHNYHFGFKIKNLHWHLMKSNIWIMTCTALAFKFTVVEVKKHSDSYPQCACAQVQWIQWANLYVLFTKEIVQLNLCEVWNHRCELMPNYID